MQHISASDTLKLGTRALSFAVRFEPSRTGLKWFEPGLLRSRPRRLSFGFGLAVAVAVAVAAAAAVTAAAAVAAAAAAAASFSIMEVIRH